MGLQISAELMDKYRNFYTLAKGIYENALVLSGLNDESANALTIEQKKASLVAIIKSPGLTDLSFLSQLKNAECICVNNCPKLTRLWNISQNEKLTGIAILNCKRLVSFDEISQNRELQHILIDGGALNHVRAMSIAPILACRGLLTLDLSFKCIKDRPIIDYNVLWPRLEALTVSPSLRKYFVSQKDR